MNIYIKIFLGAGIPMWILASIFYGNMINGLNTGFLYGLIMALTLGTINNYFTKNLKNDNLSEINKDHQSNGIKVFMNIYIKIFLGMSIPMFFIAALIYGDIKYGIYIGLIYGLIMALTLGTINNYFTKNVKSTDLSEVNNVKQSKSISLNMSYNKIFELCLESLSVIGAKAKLKDDQLGRITARTGLTLKSFGENIQIDISKIDDKKIFVNISSRPVVPVTIVDYGKGFDNVERIINFLNKANNSVKNKVN